MNKKDVPLMVLTIVIIFLSVGSIFYESSEFRECIDYNSMGFCLRALVR